MKWLLMLMATLAIWNPLTEHSVPKMPDKKQLDCLAKNIYHEARGESLEGQVAVARVTLNRVGFMGNSICEVVYRYKQFSWTIKKPKTPPDFKSINAAIVAYNTNSDFSSMYYHTTRVKPTWAKNKEIDITIGNHIFYK